MPHLHGNGCMFIRQSVNAFTCLWLPVGHDVTQTRAVSKPQLQSHNRISGDVITACFCSWIQSEWTLYFIHHVFLFVWFPHHIFIILPQKHFVYIFSYPHQQRDMGHVQTYIEIGYCSCPLIMPSMIDHVQEILVFNTCILTIKW